MLTASMHQVPRPRIASFGLTAWLIAFAFAQLAAAAPGFALQVWHWSLAAMFAAPRLVTVVPGLLAAMLANLRHG